VNSGFLRMNWNLRLTMDEYMLECAEGMRDAVMQCKRAGYRTEEYAYYVYMMMHYSQADIDRKLGRSRILDKDWLNE